MSHADNGTETGSRFILQLITSLSRIFNFTQTLCVSTFSVPSINSPTQVGRSPGWQRAQKIGALHAVRSKACRPPGRWPPTAPFSVFAGSRAQPCSLAGRPPHRNLRRQAIPFAVALWLCRPSPGVHLPLPAPPTPAGPLCSPPLPSPSPAAHGPEALEPNLSAGNA